MLAKEWEYIPKTGANNQKMFTFSIQKIQRSLKNNTYCLKGPTRNGLRNFKKLCLEWRIY